MTGVVLDKVEYGDIFSFTQVYCDFIVNTWRHLSHWQTDGQTYLGIYKATPGYYNFQFFLSCFNVYLNHKLSYPFQPDFVPSLH